MRLNQDGNKSSGPARLRRESRIVSRANPASVAKMLARATRLRPKLGIVLGSGFQGAVSGMEVEREIPYASLPGFTQVGVSGHAGKLLLGRFGKVAAVVLSGRAH